MSLSEFMWKLAATIVVMMPVTSRLIPGFRYGKNPFRRRSRVIDKRRQISYLMEK